MKRPFQEIIAIKTVAQDASTHYQDTLTPYQETCSRDHIKTVVQDASKHYQDTLNLLRDRIKTLWYLIKTARTCVYDIRNLVEQLHVQSVM